MYEKERTPNFNATPYMVIDNINGFYGYKQIVDELKDKISHVTGNKTVLVIDCYHGVDQTAVYENICKALDPDLIINSEDARLSEEETFKHFEKFIVPHDRTYGMLAVGKTDEFFDAVKVEKVRKTIHEQDGLTVIYGVASSVITKGDILVYANLPVFHITVKYAMGMDNWGAGNFDEEITKKQKRGMFLEWPLLNKHKISILEDIDYYIDYSDEKSPHMLTIQDACSAVEYICHRPFQLVPVFMKAVWGGKWLQKVFGVHPNWINCGWGITAHMNLQYLDAKINGHDFLFNGEDMLFLKPKKMLGESIFYLWGYRCPVTVNYLDTWGGGNLSLQVHPPFWYGQQYLNATNGHHESYYMMDTTDHSSVYLGLKTGTKVKEMVADLQKAQDTGCIFDDTKYVNQIPMKKHQHVYIPSGTVHCSGEGTCVLEIDQYTLATFKLYDWGRVDLDGRPRPINIDHGQYCIQEDFQTDFVYNRLVSKQPQIASGDGWRMDDSSSMNFEPMEIHRVWFTKEFELDCHDAIQIIVVVEGEEAVIESIDGSFEPFTAHYGEATFIPAAVNKYRIRPSKNAGSEETAIVRISYPNQGY